MSKTEIKKTINVIERTLEKDKKDFLTVCKVSKGFLEAILVVCILGAGMAFFLSLMYTISCIIDGSFATADIIEEIYCMLNGAFACTGTALACNHAAQAFGRLKTAETPFMYDIADKIRAAALTLVVTGTVNSVTYIVYEILAETKIFNRTSYIDIMDCSEFMFFGLFLIALSYVFNYGCKLQHEADDTV